MTKKEVIKVLQIMATTDSGCYYCAGKLYKSFIDDFPKHEKLARKIFGIIFDGLTIEQAIKE